TEQKPYEVEIIVAEVGDESSLDQIYRLTYDGSVADEQGYAAMGGSAEAISARLAEGWRIGLTLREGLALAVKSLEGGDRVITGEMLEVAVLDRTRLSRRKFYRFFNSTLDALLAK
ncbi:MAG: proteasome subunit alpha, partial [Actinobacteria bacterium]|nr:proteasome subunit alpha [Actinomycetota bacterium]